LVKKTCKDSVNRALDITMGKCGLASRKEVIGKLKEGDGCVHSYFRYHLIANICECISSRFKDVKAIYLFGSSLDHVPTTLTCTSDINLVIHIGKVVVKDKALLEKVNKAVTEAYVKVLSLDCRQCFRLLDAHFIDDEAVQKGDGMANAVISLHHPGIKVWEAG
jgi:predicted nucleotidyltransferase